MRLLVTTVVVLLGTGVMWLTRGRGSAEMRALYFSLPIAFAEILYLNWSRLADLQSFLGMLDGVVIYTGILWSLVIVSYIGLHTLKR